MVEAKIALKYLLSEVTLTPVRGNINMAAELSHGRQALLTVFVVVLK